MFSAPTKDKTTLFTMFSFSRNPKIEPKQRYLRCFCNIKESQRSQNTAICVTFTTPHLQNAVFYSVFFTPSSKTLVFAVFWKITCIKPCKYQQILTFASSFATSQQMLKHWYLQRFWTMIVAKKCYFWSVFPQISCGRYPPNLSKFPKPHFLLTCTYFRGRRHGRNLPMAKATDGLAFGTTRHCRI